MENQNYPFFKLTSDEKYPRLLITRRPELKTPEQNIYGAFLPTGMTRRMLDLLMLTFRLRPCELDIRGDFDAPCPEFFLHRCLAPCVERICSRPAYLESVEIVHLILSGQSAAALKKIDGKIEKLADDLDYERAAEWHDKRRVIEEISANAKWQIDAAQMNDVITLDDEKDFAQIHLTTLRRGKSVGGLSFRFEKNVGEILADFIERFYRYHLPKQIYVSQDFENRTLVEKNLAARFGRKIKILARAPEKLPPSIFKTQTLAARAFKYKKGQSIFSDKARLLEEVRRIFDLEKPPRRIECFDVAHLAGREIVAARVLAVAGDLQAGDGLVWEFESLTETAALAEAVRQRLRLLTDVPDLLIIDGAKPQVNAVKAILNEFDLPNLKIVGAVKPPKAHNQISHFLIDGTRRIEFDKHSKAMNFLQTLRDAAHVLANQTHRELHSLVQIFAAGENAPPVKYLLVPKRYAERGGDADDLSPIRSLTQAGEIILKTKSRPAG